VKRFNSICQRYGILTEEDATLGSTESAIPAPGAEAAPAADANAAEPAPETIENQQPEVKQLSSENYVMLVKLLKTAFTASPDETDIAAVNDLKFKGADGADTNEINETNADDAFNKLLPIISKYGSKDKTVEGLLKSV